jgi:flavin reductase (DIM6/NTAB) family NADH-FMN oxidoreductase RutF/rubredoxin
MDLKALQKIGYGLYIVSSLDGDKLNGQIANTVFQVCSEPPIIAIAINKKNLTHEYITKSKAFSISILSQETQLPFIGKFGFKSGRDNNKFEGVNYRPGLTGAPIVLDNSIVFIEAKVINQMDVVTHTIFVGEVVDAGPIKDGTPMSYDYYHQVKRGTTPKSAPSYVDVKKEEVQVKMDKYECQVCGYIYDPAKGDPDGNIPPGTPWEKLPDGWVCPVCGAAKSEFKKIG